MRPSQTFTGAKPRRWIDSALEWARAELRSRKPSLARWRRRAFSLLELFVPLIEQFIEAIVSNGMATGMVLLYRQTNLGASSMIFVSSRRAFRALSRLALSSAAIACCASVASAEVLISTNKTKHMSCSGGVCTPTEPKAVLNVSDLENMLAANDVTVKSDTAALDIRFAAPLSWTSKRRLTLDSFHSIFFEQPITVAGTGGMTITTNDGGSGGDHSFAENGHIEFWDLNSSLIIDGHHFALANTLTQLAEGASKRGGTGNIALAKSYNAVNDGTYKKPLVKRLYGTLEGLGNHLQNFSLKFRKATEFYHFVGLIGEIGTPGLVQNLTLENATITCAIPDDYVGSLVGRSYGTVKAVSVTGSVKGLGNSSVTDQVGGLVGRNSGSIVNSHSAATVSDGAWVGGLAGQLQSEGPPANIVHSYATGAISSYYTAGGLVGEADTSTATIANSFATGAVDDLPKPSSLGGAIGGLVGTGGASIVASYATGAVTGSDRTVAGGLVGTASGTVDRSFSTGQVSVEGECDQCGGLIGRGPVSIMNSYAVGAVTPTFCQACGGLIGENGSQISASYSTGLVHPSSGNAVGGLIGNDQSNSGSLSDLYWNLDTSGIGDPGQGAGNRPNDPGITGLSDNELKSSLPAGFDPQVWAQKTGINHGYPYLRANRPPK